MIGIPCLAPHCMIPLGIDALHQELIAKNYAYAQPAILDLPWGRVMEVADPFGNRIRFCEGTGD